MNVTRNVTIIGAGNGGVTMAADLMHKGHRVTLYNRSSEPLDVLRSAGEILVTGAWEGRVPLPRMTTVLSEALPGAEIVLVATVANAHGTLAAQMAPYLQDGQAVMLAPGYFGSVLFRRALDQAGGRHTLVGEVTSFPYACRIIAPGKVVLKAEKAALDGAAMPNSVTGAWLRLLRDVYPQLVPAANVLEVALNNPNPVAHPIACLLNAAYFERPTASQPRVEEWETPRIQRLIEELDFERLRVLESLSLKGTGMTEFLHRSYPAGKRQPESVGRIAPNSYPVPERYVTEDVPCGLVLLEAMAELAGVEVPVSSAAIDLANLLYDQDFRQQGYTLQRLGLGSMTLHEILDLLNL
ncbi:MAG TPA: NAD/NADP octopine/nopaline dehydrogenase family protein [Symbiobacteriaceae bacterium]|nr:NAD/NADP octopine/nopaline dehydrogenase family protein [Symbiobacteriaceae bacterium]